MYYVNGQLSYHKHPGYITFSLLPQHILIQFGIIRQVQTTPVIIRNMPSNKLVTKEICVLLMEKVTTNLTQNVRYKETETESLL
jgi:hypothetical protein